LLIARGKLFGSRYCLIALRKGERMNENHKQCGSDEWRAMMRETILPWALGDLDLGDDVLEVGPGYGATTDVVAGFAPKVTAVEIDTELKPKPIRAFLTWITRGVLDVRVPARLARNDTERVVTIDVNLPPEPTELRDDVRAERAEVMHAALDADGVVSVHRARPVFETIERDGTKTLEQSSRVRFVGTSAHTVVVVGSKNEAVSIIERQLDERDALDLEDRSEALGPMHDDLVGEEADAWDEGLRGTQRDLRSRRDAGRRSRNGPDVLTYQSTVTQGVSACNLCHGGL